MTLTPSDELTPILRELATIFDHGVDTLHALSHPEQFNATWTARLNGGLAVLKHYRHSTPTQITDILEAEQLASRAGIPAPRVLHRFTDQTFVLYEHIGGEHIVPTTGDLINECADIFSTQLRALHQFNPTWGPPRPATLPRQALRALAHTSAEPWRNLVTDDWAELCRLAAVSPTQASHVDWRCDNILFSAGRVTGVLDWESVISLPAPEAAGYAAASLTHSWRPELHQPVDLALVAHFLRCLQTKTAWADDTPQARHARLAARYKCAVRLAEDATSPRHSQAERGKLLETFGDV